MKSANALLCVPRGEGELAAGQQLPAILIADLPPPSSAECYHAKVENKTPWCACLLACLLFVQNVIVCELRNDWIQKLQCGTGVRVEKSRFPPP